MVSGQPRSLEEWRALRDALAAHSEPLRAEELDLLDQACWWLGDAPAAMEVAEEVYQRLLEAGAEREAAGRALRLVMSWALRGHLTIAAAWLTRARRLLDGRPPTVEHGYLAYVDGGLSLDVEGDPGPARAASAELRRLSRQVEDPVIDILAAALGGRAAVWAGHPVTGWAELDEAVLPLLAGRLEAIWTGDVFCSVIHLCDRLCDLVRMREWTQVMARWSTPLPETFMYATVTGVHELQLAAAAGDWDLVERELGQRSADLVEAHGWMAGDGYYTLGEVRRLRGDVEGADLAFRRARELGHDAQPGSALMARAAGRPDRALEQLRIALADQPPLERARLLLPTVQVLLEVGEPGDAATLATELEDTARRFGSPGLRALACRARAAVVLAAGEAGAAQPLLEEAGRVYRAQRYRYATAQVHEALAQTWRLRGATPQAASELATASAIYRALGAAPDLERLSTRTAPPGGLTQREVEVLARVAAGGTNRQVASELVISEKTVGRHLANIYAKVGVSSRTSAAEWARRHGL